MLDADEIKRLAKNKLKEKLTEQLVVKEVERLRKKKPLLHILFPFEITIKRRK